MMMNKVEITFKFEVGSTVFYEEEACIILSRNYMETMSGLRIIKYNLRKKFVPDEYIPSVREDDLKFKPTPPLRVVK